MINVVLFEPEIPQNTGNIMRTCAGTDVHLHLIEPLGFKLDEKSIKRCGVNYIEHCKYDVYKNFDDFKSKNVGKYYFFTRYGKKPHTSFDYLNRFLNDFGFSDKINSSSLPIFIVIDNNKVIDIESVIDFDEGNIESIVSKIYD